MVKITDVARHASVSAGTVSHVPGGERSIRTVQEWGLTKTVPPCEPAPKAVVETVVETVERLLRELPGLTGPVVQKEAVAESMVKALQAPSATLLPPRLTVRDSTGARRR